MNHDASGNYKSKFRRYKRNLRWKAGQRAKGLNDKEAESVDRDPVKQDPK